MTQKKYLDSNGLRETLQSVNKKIADSANSIFNTQSEWEAASLSVLQGWVSGNTATDPINGRTVNNFDVYLAKDTGTQYYFDSGEWVSFAPDLTNYYTKAQSDERYATPTMVAELIDENKCQPLSSNDINVILASEGFPIVQ